jgi:hypothetical protein
MSDPILKQKSLQRLLAYLEAKKQQKERDRVGQTFNIFAT